MADIDHVRARLAKVKKMTAGYPNLKTPDQQKRHDEYEKIHKEFTESGKKKKAKSAAIKKKKKKKTAEELEEERYNKAGNFVSDTYVDDKGNMYAPKDQI